jgi:hypothetical protein
MLAAERLLQIEEQFASHAARIVVIELDGEMVRLVIYLKDGTNLRVTEQWSGERLLRYSYYWLTNENQLKIGWDNAPHHARLDNFLHHKHIFGTPKPQPSDETSLDAVMNVILL